MNRIDNALTKIDRKRLGHPGQPPSPARILNHISQLTGIPRFTCSSIRSSMLARFNACMGENSLWKQKNPIGLLFQWASLFGDGGMDHVKAWVEEETKDQVVASILADSFVTSSWSQAMGDHVARRSDHVNRESVDALVDIKDFMVKVDKIISNQALSDEVRIRAIKFKEAWNNTSSSRY